MARPQPLCRMPKPTSVCLTPRRMPTKRRVSARGLETRRKEERGRRGNSSTSLKPSMVYLVKLTLRAERDLSQLYEQLNLPRSASAIKWYRSLLRHILSLENHPYRCAVIRARGKLRHLLYGRKPHVYRIIYRVRDRQKEVVILHIRHGSRRQPKPSDLA